MPAFDRNLGGRSGGGGDDGNGKDVEGLITALAILNVLLLAPIAYRFSVDWMLAIFISGYGQALADVFRVAYALITAAVIFFSSKMALRYAIGLLMMALASRGVLIFAGA